MSRQVPGTAVDANPAECSGAVIIAVAIRHTTTGALNPIPASAQFVFAEMAIHRIGADVDMDNTASAALLLKLGSQRKGIRRAYEFKDGLSIDPQLF